MQKKILALTIVFVALWLFAGCRENKVDILAEFYDLIEQPVSSDAVVEASLFLKEKIDDVDKDTAELMVGMYRDYLYDYILAKKDKTSLQELAVYLDKETYLIDEERISSSSHGEYYEKIKSAGLMLVQADNALTLRIDYGDLLEKFGDYLPESMVSFYDLERIIAAKPATENAKLIVSWKELLDRAYKAEQIITLFPEDKIIRQDVMWLYKKYLGIILMGTTNSPIFDYSTKEFSDNALNAYKNFMKKEPETVLTWMLGNYIEYLKDIDFKIDFNDSSLGKAFFDNCDWLISEAEKRVNAQ